MKEAVILEKKETIARLILNRPENRNALSLEVMGQMREKLEEIRADSSIRVLIIKGEGPVFCAGHHLKELCSDNPDIHHLRNIFSVCSKMMQTLHELPQPVIAQVHGIATAAGCQLVAACDLAIAESGARFAVPGVKIGVFCSTPMVPLSRVIGRRRALDMLLSGRFISAQEAMDFGLINGMTDAEHLEEETQKRAEEIAQFSRFTLSFGKQTFYRQIDLHESAAYDYAQEAIVMNCLTGDGQEGIRAFLEKRKAEWKNR
ncbi:MAG: enoyl-CoA hydratase [Desulfococcaceae bacterium]|jgi:enoyl-CoA hydratase/carnithine racemase|nr:enoyl-CoA hydratase [Desulfococcaceae bacterium]